MNVPRYLGDGSTSKRLPPRDLRFDELSIQFNDVEYHTDIVHRPRTPPPSPPPPPPKIVSEKRHRKEVPPVPLAPVSLVFSSVVPPTLHSPRMKLRADFFDHTTTDDMHRMQAPLSPRMRLRNPSYLTPQDDHSRQALHSPRMRLQDFRPRSLPPLARSPLPQNLGIVERTRKVFASEAPLPGFGTPNDYVRHQSDLDVRLQSGTNRYASQRGMVNFGTGRDIVRESRVDGPRDLSAVDVEKARLSDGIIRLQSGTNRWASQRGMTGIGTARRETFRVIDTKHPDYDHQHPDQNESGPVAQLIAPPMEKRSAVDVDLSDDIIRLPSDSNRCVSQRGMTGIGTARRGKFRVIDSRNPNFNHQHPDKNEIPLQSGTNKFDSQRGMTGFGTARREVTRMKQDTKHPQHDYERPDTTTIGAQMGSNKYASQAGQTGFGRPRWEVLSPLISRQAQTGQGMVPYQMGSNQFASQRDTTGFGMPRDIKALRTWEATELPFEDIKKSEMIIPSQAGWNGGDSQKGTTSFGAARDVKGKHLKRLWELEYPEEAEAAGLLFP